MDTTDFKCFRSPKDGSTYYGQVAYIDLHPAQGAVPMLTSQEYEALNKPQEEKEEKF